MQIREVKKLALPVRWPATPFTGNTQLKRELQKCSENHYGHPAEGSHRDHDDGETIKKRHSERLPALFCPGLLSAQSFSWALSLPPCMS